jgi:hypothetical protein
MRGGGRDVPAGEEEAMGPTRTTREEVDTRRRRGGGDGSHSRDRISTMYDAPQERRRRQVRLARRNKGDGLRDNHNKIIL